MSNSLSGLQVFLSMILNKEIEQTDETPKYNTIV